MDWTYHFLDLTSEQKQARRDSLDRHALYAQLTAFLPIVIYAIAGYLIEYVSARRRIATGGRVGSAPGSPSRKRRRQSWLGGMGKTGRRVSWWMDGEVRVLGSSWGSRGRWVGGVVWTAWLLALCVSETGDDYLHLTKRFGLVATSQLPLQYALTLKSFSPLARLLRTSHEHLNAYHRALARISGLLLALHACFYLNFFDLSGLLAKRLTDPVVAAGVVAFLLMSLMYGAATRYVRHRSYRFFFVAHLSGAVAVPALVLYHAAPARVYLVEALVLFLVDLGVRKGVGTAEAETRSIEVVGGTDLIKIVARVPGGMAEKYRALPGSHVYVSLPAASRPRGGPTDVKVVVFEFLYNPFSVASVDAEEGKITLVARACGGPMTRRLRELADLKVEADDGADDDADADADGGVAAPADAPLLNGDAGAGNGTGNISNSTGNRISVRLDIEGPYGAAAHYVVRGILSPRGAVDRVLLVAGGVGATFALPVYQAVVANDSIGTKAELVWAVRSAADTAWVEKDLLEDENVRVFVTGDRGSHGDGAGDGPGDDGFELGHLQQRGRGGKGRPGLKHIVDETFRKGAEERVAVMVCGPQGMAQEVRGQVGKWVAKGRDVVWHQEGFGW